MGQGPTVAAAHHVDVPAGAALAQVRDDVREEAGLVGVSGAIVLVEGALVGGLGPRVPAAVPEWVHPHVAFYVQPVVGAGAHPRRPAVVAPGTIQVEDDRAQAGLAGLRRACLRNVELHLATRPGPAGAEGAGRVLRVAGIIRFQARPVNVGLCAGAYGGQQWQEGAVRHLLGWFLGWGM